MNALKKWTLRLETLYKINVEIKLTRVYRMPFTHHFNNQHGFFLLFFLHCLKLFETILSGNI